MSIGRPDEDPPFLEILEKTRQAVFVFQLNGDLVWMSAVAKTLSDIVELADGTALDAPVGAAAPNPWAEVLFKSRSRQNGGPPRFSFNGLARDIEVEWGTLEYASRSCLACVVFGWEDLHPHKLAALRSKFKLTKRECEICANLLSGKSPSEIATTLGSSLSTVRVHIKRIYSKLDVTTQVSLFSFLNHMRP